MSRLKRKWNHVLLLLVCVLLAATSVLAADSCSLRVIVRDEAEEPVRGFNVELYAVVQGESGNCALLPEFAGLGISAQQLLETPDAKNADLVAQYINSHELDGTVLRTSATGEVYFSGLEKGVYMVLDRGDQSVAFLPYLVVLPAEIDGRIQSHVFSQPKTSGTENKTLLVVKLWDDNMNATGDRPSSVSITVLRDGVPFRKVTLSEANRWQHIFYMLPASGVYTVKETAVSGYQGETVPVAEGYIIINTYVGFPGGGDDPVPEDVHVTVKKVWSDNDNAAGKRPASITVQLISGNTVVRTVALSEANRWQYTFSGLDPEKTYTVKEIPVTDYAASYSGNAGTGITITNTYSGSTDPGNPPPPIIPEPKLISIPLKVEWMDQENAENKRPDEVTVHLLANGGIMGTLRLHSGNDWAGVYADVPEDLSYSVWQAAVEDYSTTYAGSASGGFVVTNTYTAGKTDPGVPPDPTDPVDPPVPPGPSDPADPTDPADPVDPADPTDPVDPEDPVNPADPADPAVPDNPDDPSTPVEPADPPADPEPVQPTIPQTGAEAFPAYVLMALGVLLVLLGLVDLWRGKRV